MIPHKLYRGKLSNDIYSLIQVHQDVFGMKIKSILTIYKISYDLCCEL